MLMKRDRIDTPTLHAMTKHLVLRPFLIRPRETTVPTRTPPLKRIAGLAKYLQGQQHPVHPYSKMPLQLQGPIYSVAVIFKN